MKVLRQPDTSGDYMRAVGRCVRCEGCVSCEGAWGARRGRASSRAEWHDFRSSFQAGGPMQKAKPENLDRPKHADIQRDSMEDIRELQSAPNAGEIRYR